MLHALLGDTGSDGGKSPARDIHGDSDGSRGCRGRGLPTPYAYATASGGFWESSANAGATYYFEVVSNTGATGGVQIQVTTFVENEVLGPLTPIYPPSVFYEASAIVSVGGDPINSILAGYDYGPSMTGSILQTSSVNVTIGVQTEISVAVVADAYYVDGFMLAFADPMITVPSGFTLELSPGVGNSAGARSPRSRARLVHSPGNRGGLLRLPHPATACLI